MKKPGSVQFLREISNAVLAYEARWKTFDEEKIELPERGEKNRAEDWQKIVDLAQEIKDAIGIIPKRKKADESKPEEEGTAPAETF